MYMWQEVRLVRSAFLITRVAPYEQVGTSETTLFLLGDSTGYGTGATSGKFSLAGRIGEAYPALTIINDSKNGDTIREAYERLPQVSKKYDVLLLQLGSNDILQRRSNEEIRTNLEQLFAKVATMAGDVLMISSGNVGAAPAFTGEEAEDYTKRTREFHTLATELSNNYENISYISLYEDPSTDPFVLYPETYLSLDGLHPSNEGYQRWYEVVAPSLLELLD